MRKVKLILSMEINVDDLIDDETLKEEYNGSVIACVKDMLDNHGFSIHDLGDELVVEGYYQEKNK